MRAGCNAANACQLLAEDRAAEALAAAELSIADAEVVGINSDPAKWAFTYAMEAAASLGDLARLQELIAAIESAPRGLRSPRLGAQATRYRAHLIAITGEGDPSASWKAAAGAFREVGSMFWVAVTLVELGEWLASHDRSEEAVASLDEARTIFQRLRATPWLERIERVSPPVASSGAEAAS